ncbi:hypothetical protein ACFLUZ_07210, partial [Chloroflexota bacterium]
GHNMSCRMPHYFLFGLFCFVHNSYRALSVYNENLSPSLGTRGFTNILSTSLIIPVMSGECNHPCSRVRLASICGLHPDDFGVTY